MKKNIFIWGCILTTVFIPTLLGDDIEKIKIRFIAFYVLTIIALVSNLAQINKKNNK